MWILALNASFKIKLKYLHRLNLHMTIGNSKRVQCLKESHWIGLLGIENIVEMEIVEIVKGFPTVHGIIIKVLKQRLSTLGKVVWLLSDDIFSGTSKR